MDCRRNTHTRLMATELTFSWVTSGQRSDLSFLPPSILPSALVLTWQGCHREHQNKGYREREMKGCRGGAQNGEQKHCLDSKMSYCVAEPCVGVGVKNWKEREKFGAIVMLHFLSAPCQWRRTENRSRLTHSTHSTNFLDLKHSWGVFETVC